MIKQPELKGHSYYWWEISETETQEKSFIDDGISDLTFPISGAHVTEIWLGTAEERRTREVMFRGLPGLFCSTPFFGGGT